MSGNDTNSKVGWIAAIIIAALGSPVIVQIIEGKEDNNILPTPIQSQKTEKRNIKTFYLFRSDVDRSNEKEIYIGCGEAKNWAADTCISKPSIQRTWVSSPEDDGGRCGHSRWKVTCEVY